MSDYQRIERAIHYIREHHLAQPELTDVAASVHLSESHFQRMFTRWAGISPKRYLQFLTLEHAKQQLKLNHSTVESAFASGLSGSSRLHDLFVNLEGMTPGDYKASGEGIVIAYGFHLTKFGFVFIALTDRGICKLDFIDDSATEKDAALEALMKAWPKARIVFDEKKTFFAAESLFCGSGENLRLMVKGTNFQIQVWQALLNIPEGCVTTYQTIADHIGRPKAVRAVASAIGANPVAHIIPCHRVIRGTGELGGYRWGLDRKAAMLACESI